MYKEKQLAINCRLYSKAPKLVVNSSSLKFYKLSTCQAHLELAAIKYQVR